MILNNYCNNYSYSNGAVDVGNYFLCKYPTTALCDILFLEEDTKFSKRNLD